MGNLDYIFATLHIILLISVMVFMYIKSKLHFKLLKRMYPERMKSVNSVFNPLLSVYIMRFDIKTILWFSIPVYFPNNKVKDSLDVEIKALNKKLVKNNIMILGSFLIILIWFLLSVIF